MLQLTSSPRDLSTAVNLLGAGELVALPFETVYGLAGDATNPDALRAIFRAKGRPADHPLIVHLASAEQLPDWAAAVPEAAWRLASAFWPGPLTLVLPAVAVGDWRPNDRCAARAGTSGAASRLAPARSGPGRAIRESLWSNQSHHGGACSVALGWKDRSSGRWRPLRGWYRVDHR